jgi:ABC-type glutathione transport system ATPase component
MAVRCFAHEGATIALMLRSFRGAGECGRRGGGQGRKSMAVLIEATGLEKRFGDIVAVDGISLEVKKGEVLGFLGPNGAGKSTTMKMLTGFLEPDAGAARIAGIDVFAEPRQAKRMLGYLPEGAPCYADMTVAAFLNFIAEIRGAEGDSNELELDKLARLTKLNFKFTNYAQRCLPADDHVIDALWQPEIQTKLLTLFGQSMYKSVATAHVLILTERELIILREDEASPRGHDGSRYFCKQRAATRDNAADSTWFASRLSWLMRTISTA